MFYMNFNGFSFVHRPNIQMIFLTLSRFILFMHSLPSQTSSLFDARSIGTEAPVTAALDDGVFFKIDKTLAAGGATQRPILGKSWK